MPSRQRLQTTQRARELRARQTAAESLLWYVLRDRRLCGLKFRRQFPIEPYIVDFACVEKLLVVEIDGGYHDAIYSHDAMRQRRIEAASWQIFRCANEDVLANVESVAVGIARMLGLQFQFRQRRPK